MRGLNGGSNKVPTILVDTPEGRIVLVEPGDRELLQTLERAAVTG